MAMQVSFYLLQEDSALSAPMLACRLAEKAYLNAQTAYIYCETAAQALEIDQLLWTFKEDSFIPHALIQKEYSKTASIHISHQMNTEQQYDVFINLHSEIPASSIPAQRILDIVPENTKLKEKGRLRYAYYREKKATLDIHKL